MLHGNLSQTELSARNSNAARQTSNNWAQTTCTIPRHRHRNHADKEPLFRGEHRGQLGNKDPSMIPTYPWHSPPRVLGLPRRLESRWPAIRSTGAKNISTESSQRKGLPVKARTTSSATKPSASCIRQMPPHLHNMEHVPGKPCEQESRPKSSRGITCLPEVNKIASLWIRPRHFHNKRSFRTPSSERHREYLCIPDDRQRLGIFPL